MEWFIRLVVRIVLDEYRRVSRDADRIIQDDVAPPKSISDHYEEMVANHPGADVDLPKSITEREDGNVT